MGRKRKKINQYLLHSVYTANGNREAEIERKAGSVR